MSFIFNSHCKICKWKIIKIFKLYGILLAVACTQLMAAGNAPAAPLKTLQQLAVTGTVTDDNGEPLPGVNVSVKGTTLGVITDVDGNYFIDAPNREAILVFSFIGFITVEMPVVDKKIINVVMRENVSQLDEVVVVGYGTQKKATLTGAVSAIKGEEIVTTKNENVQNMLTGKVSGLRVVQNSSEPGTFNVSMDIRGFGNPLVIVDGVPRNIQRIDSEDIESISVLKDASAAVYGLRAGNGVILITTKKGVQGKTSLNYSGNMIWQVPSNFPDKLSAAEWMMLANEQDSGGQIDGFFRTWPQEEIDAYLTGAKQSTDWKNAVFRNSAPQTLHNLNITGGNDAVTYFTSFGYQYQGSFLQSDAINYKKYNLRSNISAKISENLQLDLNISGTMDERNQPPQGSQVIIRNTWLMRVTYPVWYNEEEGMYATPYMGHPNPVAQMDPDVTGNFTYKGRWFQSNASLTYNLPFVKGLSLKGFFSFDNTVNDNKEFTRAYTTQDHLSHLITVYDMTNNKPYNLARRYYDKQHLLWNASASYSNTFGKHNVSGMILFENTHNRGDNFGGSRQVMLPVMEVFAGETDNQQFIQDSSAGQLYDYAYQGLVGRAGYDFGSKYIAEFMFRYEASSRFAPGVRWGFFPSAMAAYRISEEGFWQNSPLDFINNFKIRGSYGKMGDDSALNYQFITGYNFPASGAGSGSWSLPNGYIFDDNFVTSSQEKGIANRNLTWFELEIINLGLDVEAWHGLLGVSVDVFQRERKGELGTLLRTLPGVVGASLPQENLNSSRIRGIEIEMSHRYNIGEFNYNVKGNFSFTKHKQLYYEMAESGNSYYNWRNNPNDRYSGIWWGYGSNGRYTNWDQIYYNPVLTGRLTLPGGYIYEDWNEDGMISDLDVHPLVNNSTTPLLNYGITLSGQWKGIDLTMLFQGTSSRYTAYVGNLSTPLWGGGGALSQFLDRWHPADPTANPYDPSIQWIPGYYAFTGLEPLTNSMFNMQNAAYLRLKNLELGYSLPKKWLVKARVKDVRFYLSGYNVLTFTKLKYLDPEYPSLNNGFNYPLNKTYTIGLNLKI